jgi:hypothetical protein
LDFVTTHSLDEVDAVLRRVQPDDQATPAATLRQWRRSLMPIWTWVSSAIEVLSMDIEILRLQKSPAEDAFQSIVEALPDILARRAFSGGSQFPLDTSQLSIAAEAAALESDGLLDLHRAMAESDLDNLDVTHALLARLERQKGVLLDRKHEIERRVQTIQELLVRHYANGTASPDEWTT